MANFEIKNPIVQFKYLGEYNESSTTKKPAMESLSETTERPEVLDGRTYKLKSPIYGAALYITINNILLNGGTSHATYQPFEIFINSKEMESFQWIVSLTRMISAVFRKGGDVTFIVEELKSVNDPRGGYWKKGKYITSIVAEIAGVIEQHFIELGLMGEKTSSTATSLVQHKVCPECHAPTLIYEEGCYSCKSCGFSKCS